ncbi:GrpB family protein [Bacillus sp. CECT 9360]|uniref:GrpB family protein n=1 Tax=Bacillus sp. CECT 9360 TaxID=2845821 RepID=UPI001E5A4DAF|nr:GrpB family protein [Bacillus sp. CECT 9360]CAH0347315.1 hypothetical protein BCI9360_03708 [Bacillus sp. CECT 9360]
MNVIVSGYDVRWPGEFEEEAARLRGIFKEELVAIHHFGSTSVPGLKAKPVIDMMPLVKNIETVDLYNDKMIALGYEPLGEYGIEGRRFYRKGGDRRTHHVHIFQFDYEKEITRHLAVRDYLRSHPEEASKYGALKEQLANQFCDDMEAYINGKDQFVQELEKKALEWWKDKD